MGCQSSAVIGDNLTFSITTHDPDTGVLTDADSLPTYRVYEDETAATLLTGSLAKLDDAGTTGFYSEQIACTIANGFESGKSYNVYIEATVDGDKGGISYAFTVTVAATAFPAGAIDFTYTITNAVDGNFLSGVEVWISTDVAGADIIWKGTTDAFGVARDVNENLPALDTGAHYFWRQLSGFLFDDPDTEDVSV